MAVADPARAEMLAALRGEVGAITAARDGSVRPVLPFGIEAIDCRLAGGGLAEGALHEIAGNGPGLSDDAAAALFAAGIVARGKGCADEGTVLWAVARHDLFAPGLAQAGLPPDRLIHAAAGRDADILAVMEEGLRHGGLAGVVGEVGRAGLAATRRLQLAAAEGGTIALLLRRWKAGRDPLLEPSAACTRWRIACAPSVPLPVPGVGRACWRIILARQRGGEPDEWIMEASDAEGRLAVPAVLRDRPNRIERERRRAA